MSLQYVQLLARIYIPYNNGRIRGSRDQDICVRQAQSKDTFDKIGMTIVATDDLAAF